MKDPNIYARVKSEFYERKFERYSLNRAGSLMSVQPGLSQVSVRSCQLLDISRGGASFTVHSTLGLPTHYYLTILGFSRRIGCAEIFRRDNKISVAFIKPIEEAMLRRIVRADFFTAAALSMARWRARTPSPAWASAAPPISSRHCEPSKLEKRSSWVSGTGSIDLACGGERIMVGDPLTTVLQGALPCPFFPA